MMGSNEYAEVNGFYGQVLSEKENSGIYVLPEATRFEILSRYGDYPPRRVYTLEAGATLHIQDDGRTVKIFTKSETDPRSWFEKLHDWSRRKLKNKEAQ